VIPPFRRVPDARWRRSRISISSKSWPIGRAAHRQSSSTTSTGSAAAAGSLRLSISRHTVKDHRKHIFARLGISSLAELFAFGWRWL